VSKFFGSQVSLPWIWRATPNTRKRWQFCRVLFLDCQPLTCIACIDLHFCNSYWTWYTYGICEFLLSLKDHVCQGPRQCHRIENWEDIAPPYSKPKESGTTGTTGLTMFQDVPGVLSCSVWLRFTMCFTCIRRDCCTKEGSSRVPEELAEDYGGTEAVPFVCQSEEFVCLRRCWLLDQGNQVEWFVCLCLNWILYPQKLLYFLFNDIFDACWFRKKCKSFPFQNQVGRLLYILSLQVSPTRNCHLWRRK